MSDNRAEAVPPRVLTPEAQAALERTGSTGGITGAATFVATPDPMPPQPTLSRSDAFDLVLSELKVRLAEIKYAIATLEAIRKN